MPKTSAPTDDLEQYISARAQKNPQFPQLVEGALRANELVQRLSEERRRKGLTRTAVAAAMGTSESAVVRLEKGDNDPRLSTVARYATAIGVQIEWHLAEASDAETRLAR